MRADLVDITKVTSPPTTQLSLNISSPVRCRHQRRGDQAGERRRDQCGGQHQLQWEGGRILWAVLDPPVQSGQLPALPHQPGQRAARGGGGGQWRHRSLQRLGRSNTRISCSQEWRLRLETLLISQSTNYVAPPHLLLHLHHSWCDMNPVPPACHSS